MEVGTQHLLFDAVRKLLITTNDRQNAITKDSVLKKAMKHVRTGRSKSNKKDILLQLYRQRDNLCG